MVGPVELLVAVQGTRPLRLHVSLYLADDADAGTWVPRTLRPLGLFLEVTVRTTAGEVLFETTTPKAKRKLDPEADESYVELAPGYSFGTVLEVDLGDLPGGTYVVGVAYANLDFAGTAARPVGDLSLAHELMVDVDDQ